MFLNLLINSFTVLIVSFVIAKRSQIKISHNKSRIESSYDMTQYLFGGNSPSLAISSNIGSVLSISMFFGFLLVAFMNYGFMTPVAIFVGLVLGYFLLMYIISKFHKPDSGTLESALLYTNFVGLAPK